MNTFSEYRELLIVFSLAGMFITYLEWDIIWEKGFFVGLFRFLFINMPIILIYNLWYLGEI